MSECEGCKIEYPDRLLSPFVSSRGRWNHICGICALKMSNDLHGFRRDKFDGEMAEQLRQEAIKWRNRLALESKP